MAGLAQAMGFGGGMPSPDEMAKLAEKMPGGLPPAMPGAPQGLPAKMPGMPSSLPPNFPEVLPAWARKYPALALSGTWKKEMMFTHTRHSAAPRSGEPGIRNLGLCLWIPALASLGRNDQL